MASKVWSWRARRPDRFLVVDGGWSSTRTRSSGPVGEELGQEVHQLGKVVEVTAAATPFELAGHDVVATLDEATKERELGLDRPAVVAEVPQVANRSTGQVGEVSSARSVSRSVAMTPP